MKTLLRRAAQHILAEKINGKKYIGNGCFRSEKDDRDFTPDLLGWSLFGYTPLHGEHVIQTLSIKDQKRNNTCTQVSATVQKEVDEGVELDEQSLTCFAKKEGYITENGYSSLRWIQQAIQKWGISERGMMNGNHDNWDVYSDEKNLTTSVVESAAKHKSASYFLVSGRDNRLQALDKNRVLHTGMDWYSEFNMGGGFSAPWLILGKGKVLRLGAVDVSIITKIKQSVFGIFWKVLGSLVGGHAFVIKGYKMNYYGYKVYWCQNSYSKYFGLNGDFFVEMDFFDREGYEAYAQLDVSIDTVKFLQKYTGKFVKAAGSPAIYLIKDGKRFTFPDMTTFFCWGGVRKGYEIVDKNTVEAVEDGGLLDILQSPYYELVKNIFKNGNIDQIIRAIDDAEEIKKLYQ